MDPDEQSAPDEQSTTVPDSASPGVALREWAVTCDALARGEQILLIRGDVTALAAPAAGAGDGPDAPGSRLRHEEFWLMPRWDDHDARDVADPYRDRIRALEGLRRDDDMVRVQFYATVEYSERVTDPDRLLALDGQHTLNSVAVERRLRETEGGLLFLLLRVFRRDSAAVVPTERLGDDEGPWVGLRSGAVGEELTAGGDGPSLEPVVGDEEFLRRKAELLQLSRSVHAV